MSRSGMILVAEASKLWGVPKATIHKAIADGRIEADDSGGMRMVSEEKPLEFRYRDYASDGRRVVFPDEVMREVDARVRGGCSREDTWRLFAGRTGTVAETVRRHWNRWSECRFREDVERLVRLAAGRGDVCSCRVGEDGLSVSLELVRGGRSARFDAVLKRGVPSCSAVLFGVDGARGSDDFGGLLEWFLGGVDSPSE